MIEEKLAGGLIHPGKVVRVGDTVRRPRSKHASSINALLEHVAETGLVEVPKPLGLDDQGREVFLFIEGEVPIPPYPSWAVSDASLRSVAELLRRYHEAASSFDSDEGDWPADLADPAGGDLLCHNDVCLENVVFRDGVAVGLLDFDFAAPGRRIYDVAMTLQMCGQVGHPANIETSFGRVDPLARVAVFCEAYGVRRHEGDELVDGLLSASKVGRGFVKRRADAGEAWFSELWRQHGSARFDSDEGWLAEHAHDIIGVLA